MGLSNFHLLMPGFPLLLVLLELVLVWIGPKELLPLGKLGFPLPKESQELPLLHFQMSQLNVDRHGLHVRRLLNNLLVLLQ